MRLEAYLDMSKAETLLFYQNLIVWIVTHLCIYVCIYFCDAFLYTIADMQDNAKKIIKENRSLLIYVLVAILVIILIITGYKKGYRIQSNFLPGKVGTLSLELPLPLTNVFIDEEMKLKTSKDNELLELTLSPRKHSIIISRDGYYPWTKEFKITSQQTTKLQPIFVTINTTGQIITDRDPEYWELKGKIVQAILPEKNSEKISGDKSAKLWIDDNAILVSSTSSENSGLSSTTTKVIQPDTIIRSVDFYKNRSDVVIFSTLNAIYVIEVSKEGKQNFMPIYKGTSPIFYKDSSDYIYVWDNGTLMQVII